MRMPEAESPPRPVTEMDLRQMLGHPLIGTAFVPGLSAMFCFDDGTCVYLRVDDEGLLRMETSCEQIH